jgi:hypothetical protein
LEKAKKKILHGTYISICKDNNTMDVTGITRQVLGWIHLAQDSNKYQAVVNTITKIGVPSEVANVLVRRMILMSNSIVHAGAQGYWHTTSTSVCNSLFLYEFLIHPCVPHVPVFSCNVYLLPNSRKPPHSRS